MPRATRRRGGTTDNGPVAQEQNYLTDKDMVVDGDLWVRGDKLNVGGKAVETVENAAGTYQARVIGFDTTTQVPYYDPFGADAGQSAAIEIENGVPTVVTQGA